jgi:hypothetical protein
MSKVCEKVEKKMGGGIGGFGVSSKKVLCYLQRTRVKSQDLGRNSQRWQIVVTFFVFFVCLLFSFILTRRKKTSAQVVCYFYTFLLYK